MNIGKKKIQTNQIKFGCMIGDNSKTAIGSLIFTGIRIGVCGQLFGHVTEDIPPFTFYNNTKKKTLIEYDINKQCHAVFENINSILKESKLSWNSIIDVTVFLIDIEKDFKTFNNIYTKYFKNSHACRTTVEVNKLPTDIAIELKCIAIMGSKR